MTQAKRVLTTLEPPLFRRVEDMAARDGISIAAKIRDIVRDAAEKDEDADLVAMVAERRKKGGKFLSHAVMKRRYGW